MSTKNIQQLIERIGAIRAKWGRRLLILGHYYQKPEILALADHRGDSFQLSVAAAQNADCEAIVFCGVHFMAETADILANAPEKIAARGGKRAAVILPETTAGCPMADMATRSDLERIWGELGETVDLSEITPITYVNSSAAVKAFCGARDGLACTSSNADKVLRWAFARRRRVLFLPDQHLGRNTARTMGISENEITLLSIGPNKTDLTAADQEKIASARVILWPGYCPVHQLFTFEQVETIRRERPKTNIVVHPECDRSVVAAADIAGSTKKILDAVRDSAPGSSWAIGTERRMVDALVTAFGDREILPLSPDKPLCETMDRITLDHLATSLEALDAGGPKNVVRVEEPLAADARRALERMLECR